MSDRERLKALVQDGVLTPGDLLKRIPTDVLVDCLPDEIVDDLIAFAESQERPTRPGSTGGTDPKDPRFDTAKRVPTLDVLSEVVHEAAGHKKA